jgi:NAD-dependent SIR2 family protein deacetylase
MEGEELEETLTRAARAIAGCDVLLLHFGAGMSVDSGLAAYKDVATVYEKLDMDYDDLCRPTHLETPEGVSLFFGFWGQCFNAYRKSVPHAGYAVCREWKQQAPESFVYTSNVDNFARVSGLAEGGRGVYELHGCFEHWQCAKKCRERLWRAPPGYEFDVDPETLLARPVEYRGDGGELFAGDELFESSEFARRSFAAGPYPSCPACGAHARPAILMFDDFQCVENRPMACAYDSFCERVLGSGELGQSFDKRVAIVEVGCGRTVPNVRHRSEDLVYELVLLRRAPAPLLVRINPEFPGADRAELAKWVVGLPLGAKDALLRLQQRVRTFASLHSCKNEKKCFI